MFNIIGRRFQFFALTGLLVVVCVAALAVFGLKLGIEFSSGSLMTIRFEQTVDIGDLRDELSNIGYPGAVVQVTNSGDFQIRTVTLADESRESMKQALAARFGANTEEGFTNIEQTVSQHTIRTVIIAMAVAALGIVLYVTYAFRKMPHPFRYGVCGIVAMVFDVIMVIGIFALLAGLLKWELDLMFITGLLAVIGYSINDKIVIFDRIREKTQRGGVTDFAALVNSSLVETLTRSLITGICTLFTIIALMLFVGSTIMNFLVVLLIGILAGTYSSILVAAPLLVIWQNGEWHRFLPWRRSPAEP
ncbi:MAG: protein translocase subunit SecF [Dehalococcoidia bacterium]|nr:protein translocase subunit SecF [Dehalococcoidia bacterium]